MANNNDSGVENNVNEFVESIRPLLESIVALQEEACIIYKPEVERACSTVLSEDELGCLLDDMLSFAGHETMLAMYKRVLRRYLNIYPRLVYDYAMIWKKMYDDAGDDEAAHETA